MPEGERMSGLNVLFAAAGAQEVRAGAEAEPQGSPPVAAGGPEPQAGGLMVELDPKQVAANSIMPGASQHVVKDWVPKKNKPEKKHLLEAMKDRKLHDGEKEPSS